MTNSSEPSRTPKPPVSWYHRVAPRRVLLALGLLALFDLGFYAFVVRPATQEELERTARNAQLAMQVEATRQTTERMQEAARRIENAEVDGQALVEEIALPRRSAFSALLLELEAAAEVARIEIRESSFSVEPIEGSEDYGVLAVTANFRGRYDSLVQFLYQLDRSRLFFVIGSLGATPRDESGVGELQINMRFDTFVRGL